MMFYKYMLLFYGSSHIPHYASQENMCGRYHHLTQFLQFNRVPSKAHNSHRTIVCVVQIHRTRVVLTKLCAKLHTRWSDHYWKKVYRWAETSGGHYHGPSSALFEN